MKNEISFLIIEKIIKKKTEEQKEERGNAFISGWDYRQSLVKKGMIEWYETVDSNTSGIILFKGHFNDLQEYVSNDPISLWLSREVIPLQPANVSNKLKINEFLEGQPSDGSFTIKRLNPDFKDVLAGTDTNY